MRFAFFSALAFCIVPGALAQRPPHPQLDEIRAAMERVAFLVGEWEGEAETNMMGQKLELRGTESVESRVDGLALIVEGKHWEADGGREELVHHAIAVLTYDPDAGHYWFRTQLTDGGSTEAKGEMVGDAFRWSNENPRGAMRFTIRLDEKGHWRETGEMSRDGENWRAFFEMTMRRRK